jgi:putative membrane protein insertion efficiency factor
MSTLRKAWSFVKAVPGWTLILVVRCYQWTLSPIVGRQCRFQPTCSNYFIGAVQKYGAIRGALKGIARIMRCHPFHPGGYDPP